MQGFLACERGSTRLAVAIAAAVVAVLAVAAVPLVFGQAQRAQDTRAQSMVSRLASQVQACRVTAESYGDCDERAELEEDRAVHWGRDRGEAGILTSRSEQTAFTAYAVSGNDARVYVLTSRDSQVSKHVCGHASVPRLERDGCDGPGW